MHALFFFFLHRSCVSEKRRACLIIDRGEKLSVHHQTWILSDDIASPGAGHVTDLLMSCHPEVFRTRTGLPIPGQPHACESAVVCRRLQSADTGQQLLQEVTFGQVESCPSCSAKHPL